MATLINGDGNLAIAAAQDADWFASIMGNQTSITGVGHQFSYEIVSANEIVLSDGVIITKEGRRIQLDTDQVDIFDIPAGGADITNYYIIGYYLYRDGDSNELCEPFVELMDSSTATIEEDTFKGGADEVFVSLYRVTFSEFSITNVEALLPSISNITNIMGSLSGMNSNIVTSISRSGTDFTAKNSSGSTLFTFNQQDNNTTTGTTYAAGSCPNNTTFGTQGSIANVYTALNNKVSTTPKFKNLLSTITTLAVNGGSKSISLGGTTFNFFLVCYYSFNGYRQSCFCPHAVANISFFKNQNGDLGQLSLDSVNTANTLIMKNMDPNSTVTLTNIYGITFN